MSQSQTQIVKCHIQRFNSITPAQAWRRYGITRLAARIYDLHKSGFHTISLIVSRNGRRYAKYVQG